MATKLVSMKIDPKAREEKYNPSVTADAPIYPWGLSLNLDDDALEKLGIEKLPTVGSKLLVTAEVEVTGANSSKTTSGSSKSVSLQIQKMCLEKAGSGKDAATTLYEGADAGKDAGGDS